MSQPDILIFMTDQHTPYYSGFMGHNVDTPNMDRLAREGVQFTNAYTVCPLCTPSRMCMLTGQRPTAIGINSINDSMADTIPTVAHYMVEAGYDATLIGRMHFTGDDQCHGFLRHLGKEFTPVTWVHRIDPIERGVYCKSFGEEGLLSVLGGGESPSTLYDDDVCRAALEYLSQPHDKPQFIVVGVHSPHSPYVAPPELYLKYRERVELPASYYDGPGSESMRHHRAEDSTEEYALAALAGYCGKVEYVDGIFGKVRDAFDRFVRDRGTRKLICYLSDHGDHMGDRQMFGKQTFYEKSAKIPLLIAGDGIPAGEICPANVSIMDLSPTLLEWVGARQMYQVDGVSAAAALRGEAMENRPVYGEFLDHIGWGDNDCEYYFMVKDGPYKLMTFSKTGDELLFDVEQDPEERHNLLNELPEVAAHMRALKETYSQEKLAQERQERRWQEARLFVAGEKARGILDGELRWKNTSEAATLPPEICVRCDLRDEDEVKR